MSAILMVEAVEQREGWSTAGFHGPSHIIDQVEADFEGYLAAIDEGLPVEDCGSPLVTVLLIKEVVTAFLRERLGRTPQDRTPIPAPFLHADYS